MGAWPADPVSADGYALHAAIAAELGVAAVSSVDTGFDGGYGFRRKQNAWVSCVSPSPAGEGLG
ncbi:hypothetical protein XHV734_1629 [Xanthomonas hortorum pv. vitians]|nr:hypothetical protein XHV734_1629 [Xanthomonas hortorum pv. vitians]